MGMEISFWVKVRYQMGVSAETRQGLLKRGGAVGTTATHLDLQSKPAMAVPCELLISGWAAVVRDRGLA